MERIKRFFLDDSATAEATSTVIMIAAVGILLAAGLTIWYGGIESFFSQKAEEIKAVGPFEMPSGTTGGSTGD